MKERLKELQFFQKAQKKINNDDTGWSSYRHLRSPFVFLSGCTVTSSKRTKQAPLYLVHTHTYSQTISNLLLIKGMACF